MAAADVPEASAPDDATTAPDEAVPGGIDAPAPEPRVRRWRTVEVALVVLATIAVIVVLRWADDFFIPVVAGIFIAYALRPVVDALERVRLPRAISATAVVLLLVTMLSAGIYALQDDASRAIATLPDAARKMRLAIEDNTRSRSSPIAHVQEAAKELEKAAEVPAGPKQGPASKAVAAPVASPGLALANTIQQWLLKQAADVLAGVAALGLALLAAYFLLLSDDRFKRKLMQFVGPSLARKRMTLEMLEEIDRHVQRYMFVTMVTNVAVAAAVAALATAMELEDAASWGVAAGLMHFVPYLGAGLAAAALAVAGFLQFGTASAAALLGIGTLAIAVIIGMVFQTWLQSRASQINAVAVFVGLLFFGWLWGAWGLVLSAPLLAVAKTIFDRVAPPLGNLLG
jgi:predicted PurR-regulated permease PerM